MVLKLPTLLVFVCLAKRVLSIDKVTFVWLNWPVFCDLEEVGDRELLE